MSRRSQSRAAFTLVEFIVVFGIVVILLSIFIPYLLKARESARRTQCANNLSRISTALAAYVKENGANYPRVRYDEQNNPNGYVAFTGADDPDPFAATSNVQPNDVTASLWLLVRQGLVGPEAFVCPSTDDMPDRMTDAFGKPVPPAQRGNFRSPTNLSYSYCSPFSSGYRLIADMPGDFAVLADKNPGISRPDDDVTGPPWYADPLALSKANSRNHDKAGQTVLSSQLHVTFERTPYCGVGSRRDRNGKLVEFGDNIYTALTRLPVTERPPGNATGVIGHDVGPTWQGDSYLVPTAADQPSPPLAPPQAGPSTMPTTTTTAPATTQSP